MVKCTGSSFRGPEFDFQFATTCLYLQVVQGIQCPFSCDLSASTACIQCTNIYTGKAPIHIKLKSKKIKKWIREISRLEKLETMLTVQLSVGSQKKKMPKKCGQERLYSRGFRWHTNSLGTGLEIMHVTLLKRNSTFCPRPQTLWKAYLNITD